MTHELRYTGLRLPSLVLLLTVVAGLAAAQGAPLPADDPAALRSAIERHEREADYRAMILAAIELRDAASTPEDEIYALRSLGRGYALLGDHDRAVMTLSDAVERFEPGMPETLLAELYRDTAGMLGELGRYEQALALVERGLDTVAGKDAPELEAALLVMRGSILGALGRLDEALASIQRAMDRPLSTPRQRIMRRNNLGMIRKWRGELGLALEDFEAVFEQARSYGGEQLIVYALLELGDVERRLGNLDGAREHLDEALARAEAAGEARWQLFAHNYLAELAAAEGNAAAAESHRGRAAEMQAAIRNQAGENRARLLEISLEVLEREKRIQDLQMERELQQVRLERGRTLIAISVVAAALLLAALWLAVQQGRIRATANRELDKLANTDSLTGLPNRRCLLDRLRGRSGRSEAGGVLVLIDLDRFKRINDRFGHERGDAVLVEMARRIESMMRDGDTVARWGGEEFLAFLPGCDRDAGLRAAERIRQAIHDPPVIHDGATDSITATLGVARIESGQDFDAAFRRADAALYRGKQDGRDCVRFERAGDEPGG